MYRSTVSHLQCVQCGKEYVPGQASWCPDCGLDEGLLDVVFDINRVRRTLSREVLRERPRNHWRYEELLPIGEGLPLVPKDIGWTPMIEVPRLAHVLGVRRLRLKDDSRGASASFKDRASAVGVSLALAAGADQIACASTGNAASSLAHCAAAAGIPCNIFVSSRIPDGKLAQLLAYGARVFRVQGTYDEAWRLCMEACREFGWYNRNAAVNPWLVEGKKTGGMEIAEQCMDDPPDWVSASVGDGCSIAGIWKGIRQMNEAGVTTWKCRMLGVQAGGVAPITAAFESGNLDRSGGGDTYADSINCPVPRNWRKAVNAVRESGGVYINVTDEEIMEAVRQTGRHSGVFTEPAAAAAVAGVARARRDGIIGARDSVVAVISGNGLKDVAGAMQAVGAPVDIPPSLDAVEKEVKKEKRP